MADMASVPSSWLAAFGLSAEFNIELLKRVKAAGIDPSDLDKVRPIAARIRAERGQE